MNRNKTMTVILLSACLLALAAAERNHIRKPKDGFVPNAKTAIRIAEAVLIPIYGEEDLQHEKPLTAILKNGVWTVTGQLPEGYDGGVAVVEISKDDGRILRVSHGK